MAKKKQQENYLDYVPVINPKHTWSVDGDKVTIHMPHDGFYDKIAQKFFHRPRVSHIDLEERGSFIFQQVDGKRTIGDIAVLMEQRFGEDRALYERLIKYMQILRNNRFVYFAGKDKAPK